MSSLQIRTATPRDLQTIVAFNQQMARETEHRELPEATVLAGVQAVLSDPERGAYYLADRDGEVVGQLMITREWSDWRNGWFWWIQSVFVRPDARGAGVYRALHTFVRDAARRQRDVCGLRLYVERQNTAAQHVYERTGLSATGYKLYEEDWGAANEQN